jgi:tRNA pseudouridine13 synthase
MPDLAPRPLPLLTADLPGTGGIAKVEPEDFQVEELPAYLPSGQGEHLYLWIEKRDLSTQDAVRQIASALGVDEREVGYAGQKDRRAVTRQWISAHTKRDALELSDQRIHVLSTSRHGNKLRLGHTRGNRFVIRLRGTDAAAPERAQAIVTRLGREGLPNFFGAQRFGRKGDNAILGAALLGLAEHPERNRASRDRFLRRLALSSLQSELFNRVLAERLSAGTWCRVLGGDVLRKRASGGVFVSADPVVDQPRVDALELDVTGPMPGPRERPAAAGAAAAVEEAVLQEAGVPRSAFEKGGGETEGARRPLRVPVDAAEARAHGSDSLELSFTLPSGAYATRVLVEVTKSTVDLPFEA